MILNLARGKYRGFNDSHLAEKLRDEEDLAVSRETVRRILRAAKLASPQKRRPRQYRSRRPPRPRFGMMALTDASRHDWLEGRGPALTLMGFQDDATSQILAAHFQLEAENTVGYLRLPAHHDHSRTASRSASTATATASSSATIRTGHLPNSSPENNLPPNSDAPSRNSASSKSPPTLPKPRAASSAPGAPFQDRLVSELRLARATTLEQANRVLARFCADYNQRFARAAADAACDFRSLPRRFDLARCLSLRYRRVRRPRSHRHSRRALHRPAALARPSRLRRRNRRTLPSARRHAARLSRRHSAAAPSLCRLQEHAERRPAPLTSAQKRKTPMPRIYNLSGRPALAAVT